jgi:hypothetical protein
MLFTKNYSLGNWLHAKLNWLRAFSHSAESRLPAIPHSVEFLQKMSSTTQRYAARREIHVEIFWSTLRFVKLQLRAMRYSPELRLRLIHIC